MATSQKFTDVIAWQEGHKLALLIYKVTKKFPADERFALSNQLRRAAVSVTSNIAESFNRFSLKEKIQFYAISLASVSEVQSQIILARDLYYIQPRDFIEINNRIEITHRLLSALIKSLRP